MPLNWLTKALDNRELSKLSYYVFLFLYIAYVLTGLVYIIVSFSVCEDYSSFWIFSIIQTVLANAAPGIGTATALSFRDLHFNRSFYEQRPIAFKTYTLMDQILHTLQYFEFTEDDAGQILLSRSLSITLLIELLIVIYSAVMLFGTYVCSSMYDSGLYDYCLFTFVLLLSLLASSALALFVIEDPGRLDLDSSAVETPMNPIYQNDPDQPSSSYNYYD